MTRIKTITDKAQLPPEQQHEWDAILAERGRVRGPFGVMLHSPGLSMGFLGSVAGSHPDGVVSDALHELAILAVAYEDDAPYQWSAHIAAARAAGLGDAAIEAVRTGGDSSHPGRRRARRHRAMPSAMPHESNRAGAVRLDWG